jgi:alkanesulfonate monooxygenase SsuD/methylene tetrahydromethanopterin reductase-like flavin-dependent oxidoreductase (luciferase family)
MGLEAMAEMYVGVNTFGTPEQVVEKLEAQREILGCDHDVLAIGKYGSMSQDEAESSLRLFAEEVMPRL